PQAFNEASFITVDDRPDFLLAGDFERTGRHDLIAAASGGQSLHQLTVGSNRNLTAVGTLPIEGRISSTSLGELSQSGEHADVAVAIEDNSGPAVLIFNGANRLLGQQPKLHTLPEAARSLAIGRLSADGRMNLAMIAGGKIMVLDPNQDQSIPEAISLPFAVRSVVIGDLVADRDAKMELAVTSDDGVVHILSHGILNTQPISAAEFAELRRADAIRRERPARLTTHLNEAAQGWTEWETLAGVSLTSRSGYNQPVPILGSGHDGVDLVTIDTVGNQLDLSSPSGDGQSRSIAAVSAPLDVMPMRLNVHSRPSLVVLLEGQFEPSLVMVAPSAVFNVTKTADTNDGACTVGDCSLREAVVAANANAGLDSITFAAGLNGTPIQLTRVGDDNTSANGDLDINDDVTILGNGPTNTIVQGSSSAAFAGNMGDKVFGINQDGTHTTLNVTIQDLTVRFTRNDIAVNGLFTQTGGAMDIFLTGTGAMPGPTTTLSNVTIDSNASLHSYGGGLNIDSGGTGGTGVYRGTAQITNSTISNNKTLSTTLADNPPAGGGVNLFSDKHNVTFTGCSITGNQTSADIRSNSGGINMRHSFGGVITLNSTSVNNNTAGSDGGGILIAGVGFETVNMTGGTITGNTALGFSDSGAAGGFFNGTNIGGNTTVSGVTISNNIATAGPSGTGGGIVDGANVPISISNCTITGNSADNGGAIATTNTGGTQTTTVTNSVITGNSATSGGAFYVSSGILSANLNYINSNTAATGSGITQTGGTATVINNWWGCDGFPNAAGCQTGSGTFDADPRIDLRLAAAPTSVLLGGASTLTADVIKNTDGTNTNGGNAPSVLVGRNFTFDAGPKGSINAPLVVAIPANGTVSKTFTANTNSAACGTALPSVALDNGTQTVSITVQCAELTIAKANNVSNSSVVGQQWTWTITVTNGGNASGTFANGTTVFTDNLPNGANISYGSPATAANATCSINGSNDLSCIASAGGVTIAPAGSITVTVTATGTTPATQTNPRAGGTVTVDPGDVVVESNEANNTAASNTVTVIKANTTTTITNAASLSSTPTVVGEAYAVQTSVTVNAPGAGTPGGT
ncbi:MAG: CSLREA domain-containing protein, partial [Pyrinomonadaceae bacterium]